MKVSLSIPDWLVRLLLPAVLLYRRLRYGYPFRRIELTRGQFAVVDPEDYARLSRFKWHANPARSTFYAQRHARHPQTRRQVCIKMHREVITVPPHLFVDHINHNGLDNRKANLRPATPSQNTCNRPTAPGRYRGVTYHKARKKWNARITVNGERLPLGYYETARAAALAYDKAARKHHGQFASPNCPTGGGKSE